MATKRAKSAKKAAKRPAATPAKSVKSAKPVTRTAPKAVKLVKRSAAKPAPKTSVPRISLQVYDVQNVPEHQHFYFVNGHRVKNVKELAEVMDRIEQEVFDYHVTTDRNDFHNWVRHVFQDLELAEKLLGVTGPKHLQFTIYKHVADKALKKR